MCSTVSVSTEIERLRAVVAAQREALRPFVAAFDSYVGDTDNEYRANVVVSGAELRAARAALDAEGVSEPGVDEKREQAGTPASASPVDRSALGPCLPHGVPDCPECLAEAEREVDALTSPVVTHGRHCSCSACEREDWTKITAPCGMHGEDCPAVYAPLTSPVDTAPRRLRKWGPWGWISEAATSKTTALVDGELTEIDVPVDP